MDTFHGEIQVFVEICFSRNLDDTGQAGVEINAQVLVLVYVSRLFYVKHIGKITTMLGIFIFFAKKFKKLLLST
jgi:hypothetical protein